MTFQNFLSRVPKWNSTIIEQETQRIIDRSGCGYLADMLTCVHIIQLKILTCMRVGSKQKKVDIDVPPLNNFIHKVYVHCARKLYTNVYLFERGIPALTIQKNGRELEIIIKECILDSIRESIPLELILKTYMDETIEDHTEIHIKEEIVSQEAVEHPSSEVAAATPAANPIHDASVTNAVIAAGGDPTSPFPSVESTNNSSTPNNSTIKFNDIDSAIDMNNMEHSIHAPKTEDRLEQISNERYLQRKMQEEDDDEVSDRIQIGDDVKLDLFDVQSIEDPPKTLNYDAPELDDIEVLA